MHQVTRRENRPWSMAGITTVSESLSGTWDGIKTSWYCTPLLRFHRSSNKETVENSFPGPNFSAARKSYFGPGEKKQWFNQIWIMRRFCCFGVKEREVKKIVDRKLKHVWYWSWHLVTKCNSIYQRSEKLIVCMYKKDWLYEIPLNKIICGLQPGMYETMQPCRMLLVKWLVTLITKLWRTVIYCFDTLSEIMAGFFYLPSSCFLLNYNSLCYMQVHCASI